MNAIVELHGVRLRRGQRDVLTGVDIRVQRGEVVALMGPSGSGKTTILRVVAGLEAFESGQVRVGAATLQSGVAADAHARRQLYREVGMVFQFHHLFEHLPALDNVMLAPVHVHAVAPEQAKATAMALLTSLGVAHRATALPRELSGGEAQRVAIARALAVEPGVLLMDEPTASLDPVRRVELAQVLTTLVKQGRTLLVATHDEDFARACATRIVRLDQGVVIG